MASIIQLTGDNKEYVFKSVKLGEDGIQNGNAIVLGATTSDGKDVYAGLKPTKDNLTRVCGLVAKEFIRYIGTEVIDQLTTKKDEIVKVVIPQIGQEVVISNDAFTGTLTEDSYVSLADGAYKMVVTTTLPTIGVVYRIEAVGEKIRIGQRSVDAVRLIRER